MDADGGDLAPEAAIDPQTGRPRRFAYPPNLFVVDGGAPQVNAAAAVLDELGVTDVAVVGLAKRLEEVWVPNEEDPVILPRTSESLYLLQRIRDEAHRFAITFHRSKRSRRMTASVLDSVKGLGETRRTALVSHFGSVAKLKTATVEEIMEVPGIGAATARAVLDALGGEPAQTANQAEALPAGVGDDKQDVEFEMSDQLVRQVPDSVSSEPSISTTGQSAE
jgi:excinuclease ABC subunit C